MWWPRVSDFPAVPTMHDIIERIHEVLDTEEGVLVAQGGLGPPQAWSAIQGALAAVVARRFAELPVARESMLGGLAAFTRHVEQFATEQWDKDHDDAQSAG